MAQDNTLGADSPYEGRIYAAFVGYFNVTIDGFKNPTTNTDIFLTYSDDDGRTWSDPVEVNDDSAQCRRHLPGRTTSQFQRRPVHRQEPVPAGDRRGPDDRDPGHLLARRPQRPDEHPGGDLHHHQHRRRQHASAPRSTPTPQSTAIDAITGQTDVLGPEGDNATAADNAVNATYGFGTLDGPGRLRRPGLPGVGRQLRRGHGRQRRPRRQCPVHLLPADGHRGRARGSSTAPWGRSRYPRPRAARSRFTVTFDRPINPPGTAASFTAADVQVFYHDTTFGDPSIPLDVLSVTPVASSGVGPRRQVRLHRVHGHLQPHPGRPAAAPAASRITPAPTAT